MHAVNEVDIATRRKSGDAARIRWQNEGMTVMGGQGDGGGEKKPLLFG